MSIRFTKLNFLIFFTATIFFGFIFGFAHKAQAVINLRGRILLQVQDKGQAWYVSPINNQRYYLGRPNDAFVVMRSLGLGVSNSDLNSYLNSYLNKAPLRLAGRILLKVQDKGQAYYVDPVELKLYYLGRPDDAFSVMKNRGLGISNRDLETIIIAAGEPSLSPQAPNPISTPPIISDIKVVNFSFKYKNLDRALSQNFSNLLYNSYKNSTKVFTYYSGQEPDNFREAFYNLFLNLKSGDTSLDEIIVKLKKIATDNNWSSDELLEFTLAFVQYIPYDSAKISSASGVNDNPYFPYETLYLNKGVCSDKTFLALALLRKLGYGAAILDFPEINHSALGVACPKEFSINNSGYCYGETTNYFPLGVIPQSINNGQAQNEDGFDNLFNVSNLGTIEMYQKSLGKIYGGIPDLKTRIEVINSAAASLIIKQNEVESLYSILISKELEVNNFRTRLEALLAANKISEYNSLISEYNTLVNSYNSILNSYRQKVEEYNLKVRELNDLRHLFYQK